MTSIYLPLRTSIVATIIIMGTLGVVLMYVGTGIYHDKSIDNNRINLAELIKIEADDLIAELEKDGSQLSLNAQHNAKFKQAYSSRDLDALTQQLENEFRQYFVTANVIRLVKLVIYDENYEYVVEASTLTTKQAEDTAMCSSLLLKARQRVGHERIRTISEFCVHDDIPLYGLIVPIGGLKVTGYLLLVSDPASKLTSIERTLGFPLIMTTPEGRLLYRSKHWPAADNEAILTVTVPLATPQGTQVMNLVIARDIQPLLSDLAITRQTLLLFGVVATFIGILLSLLIINRAVFSPLNRLRDIILQHINPEHLHGESATSGIAAIDLDIVGAPVINDIYANLREMAMTDPLTHLHNRYLFSDRMKKMLKLSARAGGKVAIVLLDLDEFKKVNDNNGHDVGDELLIAVANRIRAVTRESDDVVRMGGDEFVVLLPLTNSEQAKIVVDKILNAMKQPFYLKETEIKTDSSIGVSMYPDDSEDNEELIKMADKAMYKAKSSRNNPVFFSSISAH